MLTGFFGVHRVLRVPPEHLRAFAGNQRHLSPSGLTRTFRGPPHDLPSVANSGSRPCGMTATECPRTLTGAPGLYRSLLEILMLSIQSQRTALTESLQRPFVVGSFTEMCTNSNSKVVTARRPQTSVTLSETKASSGF